MSPNSALIPPPKPKSTPEPETPLGGPTMSLSSPSPLRDAALGATVTLPLGLGLPELERFWLLSTLSALDGNRTRTAEQLGVALRTVRNKLRAYRKEGFEIPEARWGRTPKR